MSVPSCESVRVGVGRGDLPEDAAEVDGAELVGVDVGVGVRVRAGALQDES
jgi:hypothetical protein